MDSSADTYHFRIDDEDPFESVLEAIQFVKGRGPFEIEPIGRVVDPDALDTVLTEANGVSVSFTIEDLDVKVTSAGDIYVADPTPDAFIHESIAGASNLLLEAKSHDHEACVDLLSVAPYEEESLLGVLHAESIERRVSAWEQYMDEQPAETAAINVGDFPRSVPQRAVGESHAPAETFSYLPDATDLSELQATITERVAALETSGRQLVVCFDSVTRLLQNTSREQALQLLRALTTQMEAAEAVAHYHFDPEPFSEATRTRLTSLFDARVAVDDAGHWTVR